MVATNTNTKKRRAEPRKRSRKTESASLPKHERRKKVELEVEKESLWVQETIICVGTLATVLIFLSILFEIFHSEKNAMGAFGKMVAPALVSWMGWCALLIPCWIFIASFVFSRKNEEDLVSHKFSRLLGIVGSSLVICAIAAAIGGSEFGGRIGMGLKRISIFGSVGTEVIAICLLIFFLSLAFQMKVQQFIKVILGGSVKGTKKGTQGVVWGLSKSAHCVTAVGSLVGGLFSSGGEDEEEDYEQDEDTQFVFSDEEEEKLKNKKSILSCIKRSRHGDNEEAIEEEREQIRRDIVITKRQRPSIPEKKSIKKGKLQLAEEVVARGLAHYVPPSLSLLAESKATIESIDEEALKQKSYLIEAKLKDFGVDGRVTNVSPGPAITMFEFSPATGVKVSRIMNLEADLAMSLKCKSLRITLLPHHGTVGIEVPNDERETVMLRDVLESKAFINAKSILTVPLGVDIAGEPVVADIKDMPHLLVAGATGTGKSVFINSLLVSLLYRATPADLGLILIDPKIIELSLYEGIPHLMVPVVTVPKQAHAVLEWAVDEMNRRYRLMKRFNVRSIDGYNAIARGEAPVESDGEAKGPVVMLSEDQMIEDGKIDLGESTAIAAEQLMTVPKIVIVIDELADLMLMAGHEIEESIASLAQKARAAGIHLIIATQRPSVDVITGTIKANLPSRISFKVASQIDSRTIMNCNGAEQLLGRGDMLVHLQNWGQIRRLHGALISDIEVDHIVNEVKKNNIRNEYNPEIVEIMKRALEEDNSKGSENGEEQIYDKLYERAVDFVTERGEASASALQRAFSIGYNRAARMIDMMEQEGIVGPMEGSKPRRVYGRNASSRSED